jgi:uncharacterized protein (DUF2062 family)
MRHSQLLVGLINETEESLKQQVQLWDSSGVWRTLAKKASEKLSTSLIERFPFQSGSTQLWDKLEDTHLVDFQLMKLARLMSATNTPFPYKPSAVVLQDCLLQLEEKAVEFLKEEDKEFTGSSIADLPKHVIDRLFPEFTEKFREASQETKSKVAGKVLKAFDSLNKADQERLLKELNVEELSEEQLVKLIASGALATAITSVVSIAGFSAYIGLVSGIAAAGSFIGITLPFAVYMYATAGLAFITNPLTIIFVGLGMGTWLTTRSNRTIQKRLVPMLVAMSCMNQSSPSSSDELCNDLSAHIISVQDELAFGDKAKRKVLKECFPGVTK